MIRKKDFISKVSQDEIDAINKWLISKRKIFKAIHREHDRLCKDCDEDRIYESSFTKWRRKFQSVDDNINESLDLVWFGRRGS